MARIPTQQQAAIQQAMAQRRAFGIHKRKLGKPTKWLFPRNLEGLYQRLLRAVVKNFQDQVTQNVIPNLERLFQQQQGVTPDAASLIINDSVATNLAQIFSTIALNSTQFLNNANIPNKMGNFANVVAGFNSGQFKRMMRSILGVDIFTAEPWLDESIGNFIHQNVDLIKSLQTQSLSDLQGIVLRGFQQGTRPTDISAQLRARYGVQKRRANLIARDQVGKLNGQLTQLRQKSAGVESYIWRTSLDERVRGDPDGLYPNAVPSHFDREGKEFRWDSPPDGGHPGEDFQCRCTAEPVIKL
jgi:SPP1 gp7 family putative phage head morphogenesis protein